MRLYRYRLDMRACHPASNLVTELDERGFHAPLPRFQRKQQFSNT
jgi:hypothetical protein